ncbi:MAG: hypothetical protein E2O86_03005 [Bacteroidetes bacterium]|nr:MAG: hypothetical protein E2O86_03005 [Bacteroidota bacterium]
MKKVYLLLAVLTGSLVIVQSCGSDDAPDSNFIPARDRALEAPLSTAIIEDYLATHFYNYEDFENPPVNFDYRIIFDTIAGDNSDKIALINQVTSKTAKDRVAEGVTYDLYYLIVEQGGGEEKPNFPDVTTLTYEGIYINKEINTIPYTKLFDGSVVPVNFDLTAVVNGFQDVIVEFNVAEEIIVNNDGTVGAVNPGIGAMFIPSGLGYYVNPPGGSAIPIYAQLIFTFSLYSFTVGDQDNDGVPSIVEDLNGNQLEEDDDTDEDGLPNYIDADDDNDGRPTSDEIEIDADGNITYPDVDGDGIVDYLDSDS